MPSAAGGGGDDSSSIPSSYEGGGTNTAAVVAPLHPPHDQSLPSMDARYTTFFPKESSTLSLKLDFNHLKSLLQSRKKCMMEVFWSQKITCTQGFLPAARAAAWS